MNVDKQALLIVDVQNDFFGDGPLSVKGADKVIKPINMLRETFYENLRPVFLSRDFHPPHHKSFSGQGGPYPPHCIQGTKGAEVHKDLSLDGVVLIDKCYSEDDDDMSAFGDGRLEKILAMSAVRELFICGLTTEYGIKYTVLDALKKGFEVFIVEDAVASDSSKSGDKAIASMVKAGAQFVSLDTALDKLPKVTILRDI